MSNVPSVTLSATRMIQDLEAGFGITRFYGVSGANIEVLFAEAEKEAALHSRKVILAKHEFSAGCMAEASARISRQPSAVLTTSGAGALTLVPALGEAFASRTPLLALAGDVPTRSVGQGAFQEASGLRGTFDLHATLASVSRYCKRIESEAQWNEALIEAQKIFESKSISGPVTLILPRDVQLQEWNTSPFEPKPQSNTTLPPELKPLIEALNRPQKWTIVAGEEILRQGARHEFLNFIQRMGCPVVVTANTKALIPSDDSAFAGICGVIGHESARDTLRSAQSVLVIGTSLPAADRYGIEAELLRPERMVFSLSAEPSFVPSLKWAIETCDLRNVLTQLKHSITHENEPQELTLPRTAITQTKSSQRLTIEKVSEILSEFTREVPMHVIGDAGNASAGVARDLQLHPDSTFTLALGMGGMGYSFGASVGAVTASSNSAQPALVLAGDGSFFMHGMEIHTAVEHSLPILFIILNNQAHAMCASREELYLGTSARAQQFKPSQIASGLGALFPSLRILSADSDDGLRAAIRELKPFKSPIVLEIRLESREMPPFLPFQDHLRSQTHER